MSPSYRRRTRATRRLIAICASIPFCAADAERRFFQLDGQEKARPTD